MRSILGRANAGVIAQLARSNVLLAFDFDGTLAPIVADRDRANMRARTRDLLTAVCERYPCAVISGRGHDDVAARLKGVAVRYVVGNHGIEPSAGMALFEEMVSAMRPQIDAIVGGLQDVEVECKRYSLAVHYRMSRARAQARAAIEAAVRTLPVKTRVVQGKLVINVLPEGAPHKGICLTELRTRANADIAVFVGDDVTDEDVFQLEQPGRLMGIRVGRSASSAASYFLEDQSQIDALLARFAEHRDREGAR